MTIRNKTYKLFVEKMGGGQGAHEYIGRKGDIFYDPSAGDLRISDGKPGGRPLITQTVGSYRGFQAGCNQMLNGNGSNIAQIFIHDAEGKVDYINYTEDTNNDDFYVTSLIDSSTNSNIANKVIALNLYGAPTNNNDTLLEIDEIRKFVRKFIDVVLYDDQDNQINDINVAKQNFYDNIDTLVDVLPAGTLFENFALDDGNRLTYPEYNGPNGNATAEFKILAWVAYAGPDYDNNAQIHFMNSGTGYSVGDKIVINGAQMHGVDGTNDLTITVTNLKSGNIRGLTMTSGGEGFHPNDLLNTEGNISYYLQSGEGSGAQIRVKTCNAAGTIIEWELLEDGSNYLVGDTLYLDQGSINAEFEVTAIGTDAIDNWQVSGTAYLGSPARVTNGYWPSYYIEDGSDDQYDGGNYMSTDASVSIFDISFNGYVMTINDTINSGIALQPGMRGVLYDPEYPGQTFSFTLISQATDNNDIWFINDNYYSNNVKTRFDNISYNEGNVVGESTEFGGGDYVTVFDKSIFAMMAFNVEINSFYYNGYTGVDSDGYKQISVLMGGSRENTSSGSQIPQHYLDYNNYTLQSSDAGRSIYYNNGGNNSIYIPTDANCNFPLGTAITIISGANGSTYINASDSNLTEVWGAGYNQTSDAWYIPANSMATLIKIGPDKWMLSGAGLAID